MPDPRDRFLSEISIANLEVNPFTGMVFLCGGPVANVSERPASFRDAIYRELVADETRFPSVFLAEDFQDWSHDAVYRDLLTFERHLAELSAVIVLALESPGSLSELGLFSALESFQSKLLVLISDPHYREQSFIRLGPVKFLEDYKNNKAQVDRWIRRDPAGREVFDVDEAERLVREYAEEIHARMKERVSRTQFDPDVWLHQALLVRELLSLMLVLQIRELRGYLRCMGINVTESALKQILFILEKLELVQPINSGSGRFFSATPRRDFISIQRAPIWFDRERFKFDIREYYEREDKKRFRAMQTRNSEQI